MVKSDDSLEGGRMSKHHPSVYVTDSIYMRDIGLHSPFVGNYAAWGIFQSYVVQIEGSQICTAANRHQDLFCRDSFLFSFSCVGDGVRIGVAFGYTCDLSLGLDRDSPLGKTLLESFG